MIELFAFGGLTLTDLEARCQFGPGALRAAQSVERRPETRAERSGNSTSAVGRTCVRARSTGRPVA